MHLPLYIIYSLCLLKGEWEAKPNCWRYRPTRRKPSVTHTHAPHQSNASNHAEQASGSSSQHIHTTSLRIAASGELSSYVGVALALGPPEIESCSQVSIIRWAIPSDMRKLTSTPVQRSHKAFHDDGGRRSCPDSAWERVWRGRNQGSAGVALVRVD